MQKKVLKNYKQNTSDKIWKKIINLYNLKMRLFKVKGDFWEEYIGFSAPSARGGFYCIAKAME